MRGREGRSRLWVKHRQKGRKSGHTSAGWDTQYPRAARPATMSSSSGYRGDVGRDPKMMSGRGDEGKEYAPKSGGFVWGF